MKLLFVRPYIMARCDLYFWPTRVLILLVVPTQILLATNVDGPSVHHFHPVYYSYEQNQHLHTHLRLRRSISGASGSLQSSALPSLHFISAGQKYNVQLELDHTVFHPRAHFENSDGQIDHHLISSDLPVIGHLEGDEDSTVHGILSKDGKFDGFISTGNGEKFYIEPSKRYWKEPAISGESLMYHVDEVIEPKANKQCLSHSLHLHRKELQLNASQGLDSPVSKRKRRWVIDPKKKTCMLYLQADYAFYQRFGSEEAAINVMTGHIQRLNEIYRQTDFNMDGSPDDIQFMIKRVKVHTKNRTTDPNYPFDGQFEVIKFLELFSEGDYDSFCLAYLFTYRDFEGGTLGLAWTGDLKNAGGVCEKKGHFRGGIKSLNTGILTLLNYGKLVSPAVSHVTLAHEIGHNFGSPHDPDNDRTCTPGGDDGNFIMFARATAGDRRNNNKFSLCSLKTINPVLSVKARDIYGCFQEPQTAICGNGVVEDGEECDCGWSEDCRESCCYPMKRLSYTSFGEGAPCRLKPHAECSPSRGPCCTEKCTFTMGRKCRDDNGCRNTAYCDGRQAECPASILKHNKTICDKNSHVCFMGECTGSICLAFGLESCQCSYEHFDRSTKLCEVCCRIPGESECISSFDWNEVPYDLPSVLAKPGTPCRNYTGYCDARHICREVDPSGPLATLRKLLSADEGLATVAEWLDQHWYIVIGILLLLIVLMGLAIRVSRKQRLRKLTVLHSNVEAIQIQRSYLEDVQNGQATVHPTVVRKKIPFKKKVRERRSKDKQRRVKHRPVSSSQSQSQLPNKPFWKRGVQQRRNQGLSMPNMTMIEGSPKLPYTFGNNESTTLSALQLETEGVGEAIPGSSGTQVKSSQGSAPHLTNHNHETKKAILPNAKRRCDKARRTTGTRKSSGANKKLPVSKSTSKRTHVRNPPTPPSPPIDQCKNKGSQSSSTLNAKRNIQVVYRPPFSVKVEFVPEQQPQLKSSSELNSNNTQSQPQRNDSLPSSSHMSNSEAYSNSKLRKNQNSLIQRRSRKDLLVRGKKLPKSELQILIPNTVQEEDELVTPPQPGGALS